MALPITDDVEYPRVTRAVQWLIAINVAIYFLQLTVVGSHNMIPALGFEARDLSSSPWTILTYMFVHGGLVHVALNMYMLYVFGPRVEHAWSAAEFTRYYLVAGFGGWVFHVVFAQSATLIGGSAAVLGVTLAYATRWPDDEVLIFGVVPLKVKWMVVLVVLVNLASGIGQNQSGIAYLAHLGGLAAGWLYLRSRSGGGALDRFKQSVSAVPDAPEETPRAVPRTLPRTRERANVVDEIVARSSAALARRPAPEPGTGERSPETRRSELDLVLDKISLHGIDSLTSTEREMLEERSRQLRSAQSGDGPERQ
jgi:membrane associated rhomboid family serine protease